MPRRANFLLTFLCLAILPAVSFSQETALPREKDALQSRSVALLWRDPGDIRSRDLFYGPGGKDGQPLPPFKYLKEDKHGHNPKFDVEDRKGDKWRLKVGAEAQPETVAARLLWAVGYFSNVDHFFPEAEVDNLPTHLDRGQNYVVSPNHVKGARLQQHPGEKKRKDDWDWKHNPFVGTREFNGLRVMMILISNWDLKTDNNAVFEAKKGTERDYEVSDLGSSFGAAGHRFTDEGSKNNLGAYRKARFISKISGDHVDFDFPRRPPFIMVFNLPFYIREIRLRWIGNDVPRADARWIGGLLGQLSSQQIEDAFRAAGYSAEEIREFSSIVLRRIAELQRL